MRNTLGGHVHLQLRVTDRQADGRMDGRTYYSSYNNVEGSL